MKKIALILSCSMLSFFAIAQSEFDALRFGQKDILGTARYMGMAGAFSALGGDPSVMTLNPAGLGLYRSSELSITPNLMINSTKGAFDNGTYTDSRTRFHLNNFSYVVDIEYPRNGRSGVSRGAFGISFNRQQNFHRNFTVASQGVPVSETMGDYLTGFVNDNAFDGVTLGVLQQGNVYSNPRVGWLSVLGYRAYAFNPVDPDDDNNSVFESTVPDGSFTQNLLEYTESGHINEWAFSYGHNFNDKFYLGATFGVQNLDYERTSYYIEDYFWNEGGEEQHGWFSLQNSMLTTGLGLNLKVGTIFRPTESLRLALAFHSPTWYEMKDSHVAIADSDLAIAENDGRGSRRAPDNVDAQRNEYTYRTPYKFVAGLGYVFGRSAIASIDYELTDYTAMHLGDVGPSNLFVRANRNIDGNMKATHSIKLGLEYRLTPNYSVRGGFANITSPIREDALKVIPSTSVRTDPEYLIYKGAQYYSLGAGYRNAGFSFDLAYQYRTSKSDVYMNDLDTYGLEVRTNTHNVVATVGFRF